MVGSVLSAESISVSLRTEQFGRVLHVYGTVSSTNDLAKQLADAGAAEGAAVIAEEQIAGRGRAGRVWISPPGGLWLSTVLRPALTVDEWPLLSIALALAASISIETVAGLQAGVKWPNDLMVRNRKVGGILVEATPAYAIGGIGINANLTDSRIREIGESATSLQAEIGNTVDLNRLAATLLAGIEEQYRRLGSDRNAMLSEFRERSMVLGRRIRISGGAVSDGVAEGIDESGALIVRTEAGLQVLRVGEVSIRVAD